MPSTTRRLTIISLIAAATALPACRSESPADTKEGKLAAERAKVADSGNAAASAVTPVAGGAAVVTPTDAKSVRRATEFKLTEDNFRHFVAASESLAVLRKRDPQAAAFLDQGISDNGWGTTVTANNAGRKHLENLPAVSRTINTTGLSETDYLVAAIAIAQAERFMGNPKAAPPTPTLAPNAEFLNAHKAELDKLRKLNAK
jgi:hypothetical protein